MTVDPDASQAATEEIPPARGCGSYTPGHDVHYIQARLSGENGLGEPSRIVDVADDGTITFTDGTRLWNHDPTRLRVILDRFGNDVLLASHGVLRVPHGQGSSYCFCVTAEPTPCRPETAEHRPGESIVDEVLRRGGVLRSGASILAELAAHRDAEERDALLGDIGIPQAGSPTRTLRVVKTTELAEQLPTILARLLNDDHRWVLIADFGEPSPDASYEHNSRFRWYVQLLVTEDHVLVAECVSNDSVPDSLSVHHEETLPLLGWEWPQPPNKPNWSLVDDSPDAAQTGADLAVRTCREVFECGPDDEILITLLANTTGQ